MNKFRAFDEKKTFVKNFFASKEVYNAMKYLLSIFLLSIMLTNLAVSIVEQVKGKVAYEIKKDNADDSEEKSKAEKEFEKELEKEFEKSTPVSFAYNTFLASEHLDLLEIQTVIAIKNEKFISELFAYLPKLPPEMA
jgi:hypothetical protein